MLDYVAFVWDPADSTAYQAVRYHLHKLRSESASWHCIVDEAGLAVCIHLLESPALDRVYALSFGRGVVLGRLFTSQNYDEGSRSSVFFDESESAELIQNAGRKLVSAYWGRYVAFLRDPMSSRCWVLRDPSGMFPCLSSRVGNVDLYFSRIRDYTHLHTDRVTVNWKFLSGYMLYNMAHDRETGLNEVTSVMAGECIAHHCGRRSSTWYWDPVQIANREPIEDMSQAVEATRRIVKACTHAWASCFDGILLGLSGGLDSSIIAACLSDAPTQPQVVCLHDYSAGADEDERRYARLAATSAGFELIERQRRDELSLEALTDMPLHQSPYICLRSRSALKKDVEIARRCHAGGYFTGLGGDWMFYLYSPYATAADYVYRHGLRGSAIHVALDDAACDRRSLYEVLSNAIRYGVLKKQWSFQPSQCEDPRPLLSQWVKSQYVLTEFLHPLYRGRLGAPPAKLSQAYHISVGSLFTRNPRLPSGYPTGVAPLCSQPFAEVTLRVPTYVLRRNGSDRTVARRAFSSELPHAIARRRTKGGMDESLKTLLQRDATFVREFLLDGLLTQERYLDRMRLERALSFGPTKDHGHITEICAYLIVEGWLQSWHAVRPRAAA